jgi:hypothetical protein
MMNNFPSLKKGRSGSVMKWSGRSDTGRSNKQPDAARKDEFIRAGPENSRARRRARP